jgi:hypothetical protein
MATKLDRNSAQYHILRGEVTLLKNLRLLVLLVAVESCVVVGRVDEEFSERVVVDTPSVLELTLLPPPPLMLPPVMEEVVVMLLGP